MKPQSTARAYGVGLSLVLMGAGVWFWHKWTCEVCVAGAVASGAVPTPPALPTSPSAGVPGAAAPAVPPEPDVCERWRATRAVVAGKPWDGDLATCAAGGLSAEARDGALLRVNFYRSLAGIAPLGLDASLAEEEQSCALLMGANGALSHTPPASWRCHSAAGAAAAGHSNLSTAPLLDSIDGYMVDAGNATTLGHRRWILSHWLHNTAFGGNPSASCMATVGEPAASPGFVAFPPDGEVPVEMFMAVGSPETLDETGWSIQVDAIDLGAARVVVREGGRALPVKQRALEPGYGSAAALAFVPDGWSVVAGHRYAITVEGLAEPIQYEVRPVACSPSSAPAPPL
jgi:hypothetical protein